MRTYALTLLLSLASVNACAKSESRSETSTGTTPTAPALASTTPSAATSAAPGIPGSSERDASTAPIAPHTPDGKPIQAKNAFDEPTWVGAPHRKDVRKVKSCTDLEKAILDGNTGLGAEEETRVAKQRLECGASSYANAKASRESFVSSFRFDVDQGDALPASLKPRASSTTSGSPKTDEAAGKSWRQVEPSLKFARHQNNVAVYTDSTGAEFHVEVVAYGDFDGDGLEDVVVRAWQQEKGKQVPRLPRAHILTRKAAEAPLTVVTPSQ